MITITVTTDYYYSKAKAVMEREILYNPDLSGADYEIRYGDFNSIDGIDEYVGCTLMSQIFSDNQES